VPARDPCTSSCSYPCLRLEALCRLVPQIGIIRTKDNALRHVALYIVVRALTAVAASHRDPADHMADPQVQYCRRPGTVLARSQTNTSPNRRGRLIHRR